jgi:hypothetical protein
VLSVGLYHRDGLFVPDLLTPERASAIRIAQLHAACLCSGQGSLGALRDTPGLVFRDRRKDMDREPVRVRVIGGDEINAALHRP